MDRSGVPIFAAAGIVLAWIESRFKAIMRDDVERLAPSRAMGLGNLFDAIDNGRRRREHTRLFLKNRVRNRAKAFVIPAPFLLLVGRVLFGVRL